MDHREQAALARRSSALRVSRGHEVMSSSKYPDSFLGMPVTRSKDRVLVLNDSIPCNHYIAMDVINDIYLLFYDKYMLILPY
jgi:hypothetical protein